MRCSDAPNQGHRAIAGLAAGRVLGGPREVTAMMTPGGRARRALIGRALIGRALIGRAQPRNHQNFWMDAWNGWMRNAECSLRLAWPPPSSWKPSRSRLRAALEGVERLEHLEGQGAPPSAQLGWTMLPRGSSFCPAVSSKTP